MPKGTERGKLGQHRANGSGTPKFYAFCNQALQGQNHPPPPHPHTQTLRKKTSETNPGWRFALTLHPHQAVCLIFDVRRGWSSFTMQRYLGCWMHVRGGLQRCPAHATTPEGCPQHSEGPRPARRFKKAGPTDKSRAVANDLAVTLPADPL